MSLEEGKQLRDAGVELADQAFGNELWNLDVDLYICLFADSGVPFTSDDITAICGEAPNGSTGAMGGRFIGAAKRGVIREVTGSVARSVRTSGHARRLTVWEGV